MNIKLKLTARTAQSEEMAVFDADTTDEDGNIVNIGKLDVHFVDDQMVGTLLIWQEYAEGYNRLHGSSSAENMNALIDEILTQANEPLGVPAEYGVEVFFPTITNHQFVNNYEDDEEEGEYAEDEGDEEYAEEEEEQEVEELEEGEQEESTDDDDFAKQLQSRP